MKYISSFLIAFGMYSRIPVPQTDWEKSSMEYVMCFFPLVGAVIGAVIYGAVWAAEVFSLPRQLSAAVLTALPLWISGGIHMDGYMDTKDALASWGDAKKKLEILKDSHVGAFAVMGFGIYLLLSFGAWNSIHPGEGLFCVSVGFVISRTLSGLSVICFPKAKKTGSYVTMFAGKAQKRAGAAVLGALLIFCIVLIVLFGGKYGWFFLLAAAVVYIWYYYISKKQFGGITGDLAGYFVQLIELVFLLVAAVVR